MRYDLEVMEEPVRLFVLPRYDNPARTLARFSRFVNSDDIFGLDVETTAIDEESGGMFDPRMRLRMVQFGSTSEAWALDPHDPYWRPIVYALLSRPDKRFVSHTNYDPLWVHREFGIVLGKRSIDTLPMAALLHPAGRGGNDLKALSTRYIDSGLQHAADALTDRFKELAPVGQRVGKRLKEWGFTNIPLDDEVFARYAGLDAIYVRRLLPILAEIIKRKGMASLSRREQLTQRQATGIQTRGHKVDLEWTHGVLKEIEDEYLEADQRLADVLGFSPRSPKLPGWLDERGVTFLKHTKTGNGELSKDTLPELVERYADTEIGAILADKWTLSRNQNVLNNLRTILNSADQRGRIHPKIRTQQAVTGRMSVTRPAMQTFKKTDPRLRGCFVFDDGMVGVGADWDTQETRIAAALSRDPNLLRIVREGLNQHLLTAELIFSDFVSKEESADMYKAAKILDFAQQYGVGAAKIAVQLGISYREAKAMWDGWRAAYAGLVRWTDRMGNYRTVTNPWGRQIPADPFRTYANGNYMIQSSGREMLGDAMEELETRGWGDTIWLPIHDEIVLEVPEDRADEACRVLEESMLYQFGDITIPATSEIIGHRWGGLAT